MVGVLLIRGLLVGLAAGVLAFLVAALLGEPSLNAGISFEESRAALSGEAPEPELFSRVAQSTVGLALGSLVYGATIGGVFAIAYAVVQGGLGRLGLARHCPHGRRRRFPGPVFVDRTEVLGDSAWEQRGRHHRGSHPVVLS